ncbi:type I-C CRISPR-associated protein Cas5c [Magnetococcales bacterium HHB-1]
MRGKKHILNVWGDLACFTRPEMKVERYSYPIITPSAARGIFDAIYRKPAFRWQILRVDLLSPPRYIALRRNEVKDRVPAVSVLNQWISGKKTPEPLWADGVKDTLGTDQKGRTQRQTMALKGVHYRLYGQIIAWPKHAREIKGMDAQFIRRVKRGQCVYQPYFGCREFPAWFELVESEENLSSPFAVDMDLGWMVYDQFDLSKISPPGKAKPFLSRFHGMIKQGVMEIPSFESSKVHKPI